MAKKQKYRPAERSLMEQLRVAVSAAGQNAIPAMRRVRRLPEFRHANPKELRSLAVDQAAARRMDAAVFLLEWAFEHSGDAADIQLAAHVRLNEKQYEQAILLAGRALAADDRLAAAWRTLARALLAIQSHTEAEYAARKAFELDSNDTEALRVLCITLVHQRKHKEAAVFLGKAVRLMPDSALMWLNLGESMMSLREIARAEQCFRRVIQLDPDCAQAYVQLGNALAILSRDEEARDALSVARKLVNDPLLDLRAAQLVSPIASSSEEILRQREFLAAEMTRLSSVLQPVSHLGKGMVATNFYLAYHGLDDRPLQENWARLMIQACPSLNWTAPHCREPRQTGSPLRVGVISSNLKGHTIARFTSGLMRHLPRDRFEVSAVDLSPSDDTAPLMSIADRVVRCSASSREAIQEIAAQRLDIAFFPDIGMDPGTLRIAFARLAPVQCTTWGHPVTTGLPSIDYFISSELVEPEGADSHYSERLIRLSTLPTYYERPKTSLFTQELDFPTEWRLYFCPQTLFKFHPDFDDVLASILHRDQDGRVVLINGGGAYAGKLIDRIAAKHADIVSRIVFLNRMAPDQLLAAMRKAHVMLDTNPFGGGNTTYEALSAGTPVVTLPSKYMRGRVTLGCYRRIGVDDCVASSWDDYVERALRLAGDREYRHYVSEKILSNCDGLFGDMNAVSELADFFEQAYREAAA